MKKYLAIALVALGLGVTSLPASAFFFCGSCCYDYYTPVYYNTWGCDYCY